MILDYTNDSKEFNYAKVFCEDMDRRGFDTRIYKDNEPDRCERIVAEATKDRHYIFRMVIQRESWLGEREFNAWIAAEDEDDTLMECNIKDTSNDFENRYKKAMEYAERYIVREVEKRVLDQKDF